jgi:predicted ATPase/DNA-binding CsgD family transcriptional regulator
MSHVKQLVLQARLVTLTGVGGVGKSRLAIHVARDLERTFPDGVYFVELINVGERELPGAVMAALGLPDDSHEPENVLVTHLANSELLLVLDGCEHLLDASAIFVQKLLADAPNVTILVTSRAPLDIAGEHVWPVLPLSVPHAEDMLPGGEIAARQSEAVALFEDRASAVLPGFTVGPDNAHVVAVLCQQLDGLPLAIELAAVWMRSLSVEEILARLTDRYRLLTAGDRSAAPRHQTLRAAMEWSFELCSEIEQTMWARLSVFAGGFGLEDAEVVCSGDGLSADDVFVAVSGLVEKSVLTREGSQQAQARYRLLNTIREYGRDQLGGGATALALRRRHRDHYLRLAEHFDAEWFGPRQVEWLDLLRADWENLWTALEFSVTEPEEGVLGLRLAVALRFCWLAGGLPRDGQYWLASALAVAPKPTFLRVQALVLNGLLTAVQGDPGGGLSLVEESRRPVPELDEAAGLPFVPSVLGLIKLIGNDLDGAAEESEKTLRQEDWPVLDGVVVLSMPCLALVSILRGNPARGIELCEQCNKLCDQHGELWDKSWAEIVLALAHWTQGNLESASAHLRQSLRTKYRFRDMVGIVVCIEILSWIAAAQGDAMRAVRLQRAIDGLWRPAGGNPFRIRPYLDWHTECVSTTHQMLQAKDFRLADAEGAQLTLGDTVGYALGKAMTAESDLSARLTRREWEVAKLIAAGLSNRDIAERLVIAKRTSDSHVEHILAKLGFTSRAQIAAWVTEQERTTAGHAS